MKVKEIKRQIGDDGVFRYHGASDHHRRRASEELDGSRYRSVRAQLVDQLCERGGAVSVLI